MGEERLKGGSKVSQTFYAGEGKKTVYSSEKNYLLAPGKSKLPKKVAFSRGERNPTPPSRERED